MMTPIVHVIIVSYNGMVHLKKSLPSLVNQAYPNFKIFIADNNSSDGTGEWLSKYYPEVFHIKQYANVGMSAMNEVLTWPPKNGVSEKAGYIFVAGWDVIFEADCIRNAVEVMEGRSDVGVLGFDILGHYEYVDYEELGRSSKDRDSTIIKETNYVCGAASFYRASLIMEIGFLDPKYFAYAEEDDLQHRVLSSGFKAVTINTFCWVDDRKGYFPKFMASYLNIRNIIRYKLKNEGLATGLRKALGILIYTTKSSKSDGKGRFYERMRPFSPLKNFGIWLLALGWNIINIVETFKSRRKLFVQIKNGKKLFEKINIT
jgi:GT2 family glycosyltransferase